MRRARGARQAVRVEHGNDHANGPLPSTLTLPSTAPSTPACARCGAALVVLWAGKDLDRAHVQPCRPCS